MFFCEGGARQGIQQGTADFCLAGEAELDWGCRCPPGARMRGSISQSCAGAPTLVPAAPSTHPPCTCPQDPAATSLPTHSSGNPAHAVHPCSAWGWFPTAPLHGPSAPCEDHALPKATHRPAPTKTPTLLQRGRTWVMQLPQPRANQLQGCPEPSAGLEHHCILTQQSPV